MKKVVTLGLLGVKHIITGTKIIFQIVEKNGLNGDTSFKELVRVVGNSENEFSDNWKQKEKEISKLRISKDDIVTGTRLPCNEEHLISTPVSLNIVSILQKQLALSSVESS